MAKSRLIKKEQTNPEFKKLLNEKFVGVPEAGSTIKAKIISIGKGEIKVDINGVAVGTVRGREFIIVSKEVGELKSGDEVEVVILNEENEHGEVDVALRSLSASGAWAAIYEAMKAGATVVVKVIEANKGGLMVAYAGEHGFIPVSQLSPDHYPRVAGGDKNKILEKLKEFSGLELKAKIMDADEMERKLIFSEKGVWEEEQKHVIEKYKVGDIIEGSVTALTNFGAFVTFGEGLEGLVHISEIAWQRIDHPKDVITVGDSVRAQIIQIDGSKIFLSLKRLTDDPWRAVAEKYKAGQKVHGKVLKVNPFGLFVELDKDIHGLAHVTELSDEQITDVSIFAKPGDEFDFEVINLEPAAHRLGLRIWGVKPKSAPVKESKSEVGAASGVAENA